MKNHFNLRVSILALLLALVASFLLGGFFNPPVKEFSTGVGHYYINRGLPTAWSGVSWQDSTVDFPMIKLGLVSDSYGGTHAKIVDLSIIGPIFLFFALLFYVVLLIFVKAYPNNSFLKRLFFPSLIVLIIALGVLYFAWFATI